mmetsp:Transcript_14448/g.37175  ORF Transcript_14448/g.37175 Transcript_14448/m.37175 type:complete len:148 (-) Transcript_14448:588-1031(-)
MAGYPYFVVVSREGKPIFEEWFDTRYAPEAIDQAEPKDDLRYFHQLLAHKALDALMDTTQDKASHMYLKVIDTFNEWAVSAYVTGGQTRLLLLHDRSISNNDGIKNFFQEVHEVYVKAMLNPLYSIGAKIESKDFKAKVRSFAVRYL